MCNLPLVDRAPVAKVSGNMLISFSVENYRSYRERQTMSLLAEDSRESIANTTAILAPALKGRRVLNVAAIYGANASGKSNFIRAFNRLIRIVTTSAKQGTENDRLPVTPFELDDLSKDKPSCFSTTFIINEVVYVYDVALSRDRVHSEELTAFPKTHPQRLFSRTVSKSGVSTWHFSRTHFRRDPALEMRTRRNSLYVSVGAVFNHKLLKEIFKFFALANTRVPLFADQELLQCSKNESFMAWASKMLAAADTGIADIRAKTVDRLVDLPEEIRKTLPEKALSDLRSQPDLLVSHRKSSGGETWWPIGRESDGTRQLLSLLRSWHGILYNGRLAFVDELNDSLHPLLSRRLLQMLAEIPPGRARGQLIFTTHDSTLLDPHLLRRDQIFFTEKSSDGATTLYSLLDYTPRKDEAMQKGYLAGRYGGIPFFGEFKFEENHKTSADIAEVTASPANGRRKKSSPDHSDRVSRQGD